MRQKAAADLSSVIPGHLPGLSFRQFLREPRDHQRSKHADDDAGHDPRNEQGRQVVNDLIGPQDDHRDTDLCGVVHDRACHRNACRMQTGQFPEKRHHKEAEDCTGN